MINNKNKKNSNSRKKLSLKIGNDINTVHTINSGRTTVEIIKKRKKFFIPNKSTSHNSQKTQNNYYKNNLKVANLSILEQEARNKALAFSRANAVKDDARRKMEEIKRSSNIIQKNKNHISKILDIKKYSTLNKNKIKDISINKNIKSVQHKMEYEKVKRNEKYPCITKKNNYDSGNNKINDNNTYKPKNTRLKNNFQQNYKQNSSSNRYQGKDQSTEQHSKPSTSKLSKVNKTLRRNFSSGAKKDRPDQNRTTAFNKNNKGMIQERNRVRLTLSNALSNDIPRERSLASMRRRQKRVLEQQRGKQKIHVKVSREVIIPDVITIQELSNRMAERTVDVIKIMMQQGQMVKASDNIDTEMAELIVEEMGHIAIRISESDIEKEFIIKEVDNNKLKNRAPIVTVMGHVDHGKTSLLDVLRNESVTDKEVGGITQHIGAYQVTTNKKQIITFLDTPGHAAFTEMRLRGANITDIIILVVAADDGVMPQTIEAINHAKIAKVPLIIAINKMDKSNANSKRVRNELLQNEVFVESLGGDVLEVEISVLKKTGLNKLIDAVLLQAELIDVKANPDRLAYGTVVEAKLDRNRGPVSTVLVQNGTLKIGDIIVAGVTYGKVRALINDHNCNVMYANPSMPVEILGLSKVPLAGESFAVVKTEIKAREITDYRINKIRDTKNNINLSNTANLKSMMINLKSSKIKEFNILLKGDVQGSIEAIINSLIKLNTDEVKVCIIYSGVGAINETDLQLATISNAVIIAFNVRPNLQVKEQIKNKNNKIHYYSIIYNLIDDIKDTLSGLLDPITKENFLGYAKIIEIFNINKLGKIGGCIVTEGTIRRGLSVRLLRDNIVIYEGKLATLKRFKDEVNEVHISQECGVAFDKYNNIKINDVIECFEIESIKRKLK